MMTSDDTENWWKLFTTNTANYDEENKSLPSNHSISAIGCWKCSLTFCLKLSKFMWHVIHVARRLMTLFQIQTKAQSVMFWVILPVYTSWHSESQSQQQQHRATDVISIHCAASLQSTSTARQPATTPPPSAPPPHHRSRHRFYRSSAPARIPIIATGKLHVVIFSSSMYLVRVPEKKTPYSPTRLRHVCQYRNPIRNMTTLQGAMHCRAKHFSRPYSRHMWWCMKWLISCDLIFEQIDGWNYCSHSTPPPEFSNSWRQSAAISLIAYKQTVTFDWCVMYSITGN